MTDLISPVLGTQPTVPSLDGFGYTPFKDVQPFSQRAASGYQDSLEQVIRHLFKLNAYLTLSNPQGVWDANVVALIGAVDSALSAQTADNAAKVATALDAIATSQIQITDPAMRAVLNDATTATRVWLDGHYTTEAYADGVGESIRTDFAKVLGQNAVIAPAPQGGGVDDTSALMAVIGPAHATGGTVYLQSGTYLCNLDLPAQFPQVKIIGAGMRSTVLQAFSKTKPVVKFNGGSGAFGGGGLYECTLTSASGATYEGIALAFSGTTGCSARMVRIAGSFSEGVRFWNERGANGVGDFSEFNTFHGDISGCRTPFAYQVDNGVESFHGSGVVEGTTINIPGDNVGPIVDIRGIAMPYNAPMSFNVWLHSGYDTYLFKTGTNANGRHRSFYGNIQVENNNGGTNSPASRGFNRVLFNGRVSWLGTGSSRLGTLYLCKKIGYEGGNVWGDLEPVTSDAPLKNSPTIIATDFEAGSISLVAITISAPNYEFHALLAVQHSRFDGSQAYITEITRTQDLDTGNKGDPQFYYNSALYASNPNFDTTFHAYVTITHLGGGSNHMLLAQASYS